VEGIQGEHGELGSGTVQNKLTKKYVIMAKSVFQINAENDVCP
jgi:hypothetical protein